MQDMAPTPHADPQSICQSSSISSLFSGPVPPGGDSRADGAVLQLEHATTQDGGPSFRRPLVIPPTVTMLDSGTDALLTRDKIKPPYTQYQTDHKKVSYQ